MSFYFKKLEIKDWRVYGGKIVLEFPKFTQGKNLVVINGLNGFGKTSLLKALQFLFHDGYSREELIDAFNEQKREKVISSKSEGYFEVSLEYTYKGQLCKLTRVAELKLVGSALLAKSRVELIVDGQAILDQIDDKIAELIPKECQQFVLFDAAEITRYAEKQQSTGVKDAIEKVLGIPAVRNLRDDLEKLVIELENEQADFLTSQGEALDAQNKVEDLRSQVTTQTAKRTELQEKISANSHALEELDKETAQIQAIEAERAQLLEKKKRRADYEERFQECEEQIVSQIQKAPLRILSGPLSQIVEATLSKQEGVTRRVMPDQKRQLIEDILEHEACICGRSIDSKAEKHLLAEIVKLKKLLTVSEQRNQSVPRDIIELSALVKQLRAENVSPISLIERRSVIMTQVEEIEKDIGDLEKKLAGHELVKVRELMEQKQSFEKQLGDLRYDLGILDSLLTRSKRELEEEQRKLDKAATNTEQGRGLTELLQKTRRLRDAAAEYVDELVKLQRTKTEQLASETFIQITNKPAEYAEVRIRDDYTLEVRRRDGSAVDNQQLSAGEKEVLAYSFITALNLSSPNPAPFVMDTPFGHLDSKHREGLLKSLPRLKVQVFLLATDRDLPDAEHGKIAKYIAKDFVIKRDQKRAVSTIEEQA